MTPEFRRCALSGRHATISIFLLMAALTSDALSTQAIAGQADRPSRSAAESAQSSAGEPSTVQIRGSVEQIHIVGAASNSLVTIEGPGGFQRSAATDDRGVLVLQDIPPGDGYRVTVADSADHTVRVLDRRQHPGPDFYESQKLEPTRGYLETRDGTLLSYRVVLPDASVHGAGPYDLVITYSGYQPGLESADGYQNLPFEKFTSRGYAVAGVNMRGSGCSGGAFHFMEPLTWLDGYDMVEAFAAQDWVDDVALGDQSWPGLTQLFVASTQPPSLTAIVAGSVVGDFYRDVFYPGGIPNVGFAHIWAAGRDAENSFPSTRREIRARIEIDPICAGNQALRSQNVSLLETVRAHPYDDHFWRSRCAERLVEKITVPVLQVVSWQDVQVSSRAAILAGYFKPETPVRLVGVNGFHQYWSGDVWEEIVQFLDVYLGDAAAAITDYEAGNSFVVLLESNASGEARGRFTLPEFSAAGNGRRLFLGADLAPDDADPSGTSSTFDYDPHPPGSWTAPVQDQASFTSESLSGEVVIAGSGSVDLWIAVAARDVDLQVTLSEVRPDGQEMLVQSGWLRASRRTLDEELSTPLRPHHRHTEESIQTLTPCQWTRVRIELLPVAHVFRSGSRMRLSISGPGAAGNAWPWSFEALPGGFEVRIGHDAQRHPSSVVLPIVQPADLSLPSSLPACESVWLQPCRPANHSRAAAVDQDDSR